MVMDYSLLLGLEEVSPNSKPVSRNGALVSADGKHVYHFGVIDFLCTFKLAKQLEVIAKSTLRNAKKEELSAMRSKPYGNRFYKFMKNEVFNASTSRLSH